MFFLGREAINFHVHTLKKLATIKNIDTENLDKITTENFNKLFFQ